MSKEKINIVEEKRRYYRPSNNDETVAQAMYNVLRRSASFTAGDQERPCAILWTDPESLWQSLIPELKTLIPELFVFGNYDPDKRTGPAIWLRCVEARLIEHNLPIDQVPVFYLPGVSRQKLREVEDCPEDLQPLVEMQFRGTVWVHPNGKDWTPYAFLTSEHGGLGLDIVKDSATTEALSRALSRLLKEKVIDLRGQSLNADFFNQLLTPDVPVAILHWMDDPNQTKSTKSTEEWKAFSQQCITGYGFHPDKDGELRAAELLARRQGNWKFVWDRFTEAPQKYPRVVNLLERITPPAGIQLLDQDSWPFLNAQRESELSQALLKLKDKRPDEARPIIHDLEKSHGNRRNWVWAEIDRSQFAVALEHIDRLATLTEKPIAAALIDEMGELYFNSGWETDAAALEALACCNRLEHEEPLCTAVRSVYGQWLDNSARNLQNLLKADPNLMKPRLGPVEASNGRIILFVDGLRLDLAKMVKEDLQSQNLQVDLNWDWAPFPSVTDTAKPYVSPIAHLFKGGEAGDEFAPTIADSGQRYNNERFCQLLVDNNIQVLKDTSLGDSTGKAWTEIGDIDEHGHNEGWKLARSTSQEIQDITDRVSNLLASGWKEVLVVTDHGWLLLPGGFAKVELPKFLVEHRWGRCASMKEMAATTLPLLPWYWNPAVSIASPPGVGCFKAGSEYVHGGISLQELVVPRIIVKATGLTGKQPKIASIKWIGLRCRVSVDEPVPGLKVDLRIRQADAASSKVEGAKPREIGIDGTVSLPVSDDRDEGIEIYVILLAQDGHILDSKRTIVGGRA